MFNDMDVGGEESSFPCAEQAYDSNGVDLSLIDWMLSLTPVQRLEVLQDAINFFAPFQPDDGNANP